MANGSKHFVILMAVPLQNLTITAKAIPLKQDSFSDTQIPKTGC